MVFKDMASARSSLPGGPAADSPEIETMSISQLMEFLQSSFQKSDFERAERTLVQREESIKAEIEKAFSEELTLKEVGKIELMSRIDGLQRDLGALRSRCSDLEHQIKKGEVMFDLERAELERKLMDEKEKSYLLADRVKDLEGGKLATSGEFEKYKQSCEKLQEQIAQSEEEYRVLSVRRQKAQEKIVNLVEPQKQQGDIDFWRKKCQDLEMLVSRLENENMSLIETGRVNQGHCFLPKQEMNPIRKGSALLEEKGNQVLQGVIEISDSEDEKNAKDYDFKGKRKEEALIKESGLIAEKGMKITQTHYVHTGNLSELYEDCSESAENLLSVPTPKRKRTSKVVISDSEDEDNDDNVPISKLKIRRLKQVVEDNKEPEDALEEITTSRRRLVSLRECYESQSGRKGSSARDPSTPSTRSTTSRDKATACRKLDYVDSEDDEVDGTVGGKEVNDDGSDESLGGFIVSGSDSQESTSSPDGSSSEVDSDLDLNNVLADIRREKVSKQWEYEADMLSSFSKDPDLCLKAVCALYRQQTSEEKAVKGALFNNKRGFNKLDAERGSMMAEFLLDGDIDGPLKKSVQELDECYPNGLDYCHKLANRYSKQLFTIYQNKEDPFFHPS